MRRARVRVYRVWPQELARWIKPIVSRLRDAVALQIKVNSLDITRDSDNMGVT